jgi:hypothetical protein
VPEAVIPYRCYLFGVSLACSFEPDCAYAVVAPVLAADQTQDVEGMSRADAGAAPVCRLRAKGVVGLIS